MKSLLNKDILVLDGGLGTTLEDEHEVKFSYETPLWSSHVLTTDQDIILRAQVDFVNAGADIILTPTYQASHRGFRQSGIENPSTYFTDAVRISRRASQGCALVALSLGPYGAILQPSQEFSGDYDIDEDGLLEFHSQRLAEFNSCWDEMDLVAFETLPRLNEVRAVKKAYRGPHPYWISCIFPNEDKLPDNTSIEELLPAMLTGTRPWAIGLNCTKVHKVSKIITGFENAAENLGLDLPRLVVYPDGTNGQVYDTTTQRWIGKEIEDAPWDKQVVDIVTAVHQRGKWEGIVVGGCCKSSPQHIKRLRMRMNQYIKL